MCHARGANETLPAVLFPAKEPLQRYPLRKIVRKQSNRRLLADETWMIWDIVGRLQPQTGVINRAGVSIMRPLLCVGLLLSFGGCVLFKYLGQRYVVFFRGSSAQMEDAAEAVLVGAADWAKKHRIRPYCWKLCRPLRQ